MKPVAVTTLLTCFLLASSTLPASAGDTTDAAASQAADATVPNELLRSFLGTWEGTCQTWLQPGKLADESKIKGEFIPLLDGRFVRHRYEGSMQGKPRHGEEAIAFHPATKQFQVAWIDDYHTGNTIMFSEGTAAERAFTVAGKYVAAPDAPPWGWRTVFEVVDQRHVKITAYISTPDGLEAKAVETNYTRTDK